MSTVTITDISRNLADYVNRVAYKGESFLLVRGRKPVAELRPLPSGRRLGDLLEILDSLPKLPQRESEIFSQDLDAIRKQGNREVPQDPWES